MTNPLTYCYIRKSTDKQTYERQYYVLKERGYINGVNCTYVEETYTGRTIKRPIFDKLLKNCKENDTIVVESLTRLSRGGLYQTVELVKNIVEKKKINLVVLKENLTFNAGKNMDSITKLILGIFSIVAEFERDQTSERTKEYLQGAKKNGTILGRRTNFTFTDFIETLEYNANGLSVNESIKITKYPKSTFILRLKESREKYKIEDKKELLELLRKEVNI